MILVVILSLTAAAGSSEPRRVDKKLVGRFKHELCIGPGDMARAEEQQARLNAVEGTGETGRQVLLYMAESRWERTFYRECAVHFLGELGERRALPVLRQILAERAEDPKIRADALDSLVAFHDVESIPTTIAIFERLDQHDDLVWSAALRAMGRLDDERIRVALRAALVDPNLPDPIRESVLSRVAEQQDVQSIPLLSSWVQSNDDKKRMWAAWTLAAIGSRDGIAAAREAFAGIKDPRARQAAASEMSIALKRHRQSARDQAEIAEIDALTELIQPPWR